MTFGRLVLKIIFLRSFRRACLFFFPFSRNCAVKCFQIDYMSVYLCIPLYTIIYNYKQTKIKRMMETRLAYTYFHNIVFHICAIFGLFAVIFIWPLPWDGRDGRRAGEWTRTGRGETEKAMGRGRNKSRRGAQRCAGMTHTRPRNSAHLRTHDTNTKRNRNRSPSRGGWTRTPKPRYLRLTFWSNGAWVACTTAAAFTGPHIC